MKKILRISALLLVIVLALSGCSTGDPYKNYNFESVKNGALWMQIHGWVIYPYYGGSYCYVRADYSPEYLCFQNGYMIAMEGETRDSEQPTIDQLEVSETSSYSLINENMLAYHSDYQDYILSITEVGRAGRGEENRGLGIEVDFEDDFGPFYDRELFAPVELIDWSVTPELTTDDDGIEIYKYYFYY